FEGNMLNLSIGPGELLTTPLQVARYNAALASGQLLNPHVFLNTPQKATPLPISAITLEAIRSIMHDVVARPTGTGHYAQVADVSVAGKTGTAQNPHGKDHAWFVSFAPVENPRIAVTVLVENGGFGSTVAAPIAQKVLKAYFEYYGKENLPNLVAAQKVPTPIQANPR
ncbi:MAG: penicillin-binding transpeptidase domain-containing protein, partial [Candidatus Latescibacterota bacterium]